MVLTSKYGCGRSGLAVQYAASTDVARQCGNTLVFLDVQTQKQRLLVGGGQGIQSFFCNAKAGLLAVAEQGYQPRIEIYRQADLKQLQSIQADAEFAYTAVALSDDGELLAVCSDAPNMQLSIWQWKKKRKLVAVSLQHAVSSISFHPADPSCLLTVAASTGSSGHEVEVRSSANPEEQAAVQLWRLDKLWSRHELHAVQLQLPVGCSASCHAWAPEGVYLGCRNGAVLCLDPESSAVLGMASITADSSAAATGISSIAVNKDAVVVASTSIPRLLFYGRATHALPEKPQQQQQHQQHLLHDLHLLGGVAVSTQGCESLCFGGPLHKDLVATTTDGSLLLLTRSKNNSSPADVQVEPLADFHAGHVTGLAAAPDGAHIVSCGSDGSVRAWATATGQLVGKRDLGGRLTCCATALGNTAGAAASKPVLAVGSEGGILRLLALTELQRLPVIHRSRLHKSAVTHVAYNPDGTCLAVAAAADKRVALLSLRGCEHVDVLGYFTAADNITSLCWFRTSASSQAQLLLSLAGGGLVALTPPSQPCSSSEQHAALELDHSCTFITAAEVPLLQLAAIPPSKHAPSISSNGGSNQQTQQVGAQVLGLGSDGQLHRLLLPADTAGWAGLKGKVIRSIAKLQLPVPGTAIALSPSGHSMMLAGQDGSLISLPALSAAATATALAAYSNSSAKSSAGAADSSIAGSALAHGSSEQGAAAGVLAWSATGQWAASAARDGSLLLHAAIGDENSTELPRTLPLDASSIADQEAPDDSAMPTVPDAAEASAAAEGYNAGAAARQATLQKLQTLQSRLAQVMQASAAAPPDQRLSDAELILDIQRLEELRASVDAEVASVKTGTCTDTQVTEVRAQRLKSLCWDSMQTKGAVCTGLKSGSVEVWNFPLPAQDEARWAKVANLRRTEIIAAAAQGSPLADQSFVEGTASVAAMAAVTQQESAANGAAVVAAAAVPGTTGTNAVDADADGPARLASSAGTASMSGSTVDGSVTSARESARDSMVNTITADQQLLAKIGSCAASACKAGDLLYPELDVTFPGRKLTQAELYKRMVWELKSQFNEEFSHLVKQKHCDADRLADLASRTDELVRELVKIHLVLNPAAPAAQASTAEVPSNGPASGSTSGSGSLPGAQPSSAAGPGTGDAVSGEQLAAELTVGRLTAHWSPLEDLEDMLVQIKPGEVKAPSYLSPAERAKAAAEEAAAEEARMRVAADDSADRALKQMMGGRLERATDEVADLVASRPPWMNGDPASFSEEQLREYKEYCAKEQAAIEERLKRKAVMETELRTLRASAEDVAAKFDEAVAALAAKRLDLQMEVAALECRILRLMADYEVAAVTAGREAEQQAVDKLQAVQDQLVAVEKELAETQELHSQQQEALSSLQADARSHDRALKAEFAEADSAALSKLVSLYKNRIAFAPGTAATAAGITASTATGSAELEFQPLSYNTEKITSVMGSAAGGGAAAAAATSSSSGAGAGIDLRGPSGPAPIQITALTEAQMPDGLDAAVWEKFVEYRAARGQMDIALREQAAQHAWLQRQQELLVGRHTELSRQVEAAAEELEVLRTKRAAATFDVELQLRLKQGQVECSPAGVAASAPDALLVGRDQVAALNSSILAKGNAKLDLLRQMKEFKRGIYQMEWENRKCEMEAEDMISLTQQLQLLHVTKEFQQLVKGSSNNAAAAAKATGTGGSGSGSGQSAANKEVQSLENLLQVRESLHQKAVAEKRRQLRRVEGLIAAKQQENASVALHLSGLEKLLDDRSRLEGAVAAGDPGADRVMRTLMMQRKLQDIAAAQAAEIAAAETELQRLQQRSFPCFPDGVAAGSNGACIVPAMSATASSSSHPAHGPANSTKAQPASAAKYGGGVVAAPGGAFAPAGSRALRPVAPQIKAVAPDTKVTGSPRAAAQPGRLVAPQGGKK